MDSIIITKKVKKILKTYNLSPIILKTSKLKKDWQNTIPDFVIQIIVEQTKKIILDKTK